MKKVKMFVYTDLESKETIRKDFTTKKQIDNFFNPDTMFPIMIVDKIVYPTGCYRVTKESYWI